MRNFIVRGVLPAVVSALVAFAVVAVQWPSTRQAAQSYGFLPTTGTYSGAQAANYINDALNAALTCNKATSPPVGLSGSAEAGLCWLDNTSATLLVKKRYTGSAWVTEGVLDVSNGVWVPPVGGGAATLASASTADLCVSPQSVINLTGTTTVTAFGSTCVNGTKKTIIFGGAVPLTYNFASLIIPGATDYTAAVGDVAEAVALGGGNWRVTNITRINGNAVTNPAVEVGTLHYFVGASAPTKYVFGYGQALTRASYPDFVSAVSRAQSAVRTSGSPTLTGIADTSGFGAGMPIEGTGISGGTTVVSVTSNTITMSGNAGSSGTATATVFLTGYGSGGSSSTIGVPDCRGRVMAGRDDMGGTAASRITSTYFGTSASAMNAAGGDEKQTLTIAQMPAHDHGGATGSASPSVTLTKQGTDATYAGAGATYIMQSTTANALASVGGSVAAHTHSISSQGGGAAHPILPPTLIANCIIRVLAMNEPANDNAPRGASPIAIASRRFA